MVQFKDVFTGREKRDYSRAASSQKCVRAGGKHNDLDNVGYTGRHHTFFEMLGNFSFGDYFKDEAIRFAWELVTDREKGYGLEPERLWATVYLTDDDAAALWERYLPKDRILRFGEAENFWAMGETGPCGPCSEASLLPGRRPCREHARPRQRAGRRDGRDLEPRLHAVRARRFRKARPSAAAVGGHRRGPRADHRDPPGRFEQLRHGSLCPDSGGDLGDRRGEGGTPFRGNFAPEDAPFRVIADHARAATMLIADGVLPSNEGRGYVLRRILRRALRYGRRLGLQEPFLHRLPPAVVGLYRGIHIEPKDADSVAKRVAEILRPEEERFARTLSEGIDRVGEAASRARERGEPRLAGETVFRFYDTHGIPIEVIEEIAADEGVTLDREGFESQLEAQRRASRSAGKFEAADVSVYEKLDLPAVHSAFRGYPEHDFVSLDQARIVALVKDGQPAARLESGDTGEAVADRTVFYPEGGGQVADTGTWTWPGGEAEVLHVWKPRSDTIAHRVRVTRGALEVGAVVDMRVPEWVRRRTQANHTGTHLVHAALRKVLGVTARQMGSLVAPDRLRFDYAVSAPPTPAQIAEIERLVNEEILRDREVTKSNLPMEEARRRGADMFFWDKYSDSVRVVEVPGFSIELCGGCHVPRTGEIGAFKIVSDKSLAAGVRRLEAVTSLGAVDLLSSDEETLNRLSAAAQAPREALLERWDEREERLKALERELTSLKMKLASGRLGVGRRQRGDRRGLGRHPTRSGSFHPGASQPLRHAPVAREERSRSRGDFQRGEDVGRRGCHAGPGRPGAGFPSGGPDRTGARRIRRRKTGPRAGGRPAGRAPAGSPPRRKRGGPRDSRGVTPVTLPEPPGPGI